MRVTKHHMFGLSIGGVFVLLDQGLKYASFTLWNSPVGWQHVAWTPFFNPGIAFGIPLVWWVQLLFTPLLLWGIYRWAKRLTSPLSFYLTLALFAGAVSNAIDRAWTKGTIDYLRVGTAVLNLADILVVIGILGLIAVEWWEKRTTSH